MTDPGTTVTLTLPDGTTLTLTEAQAIAVRRQLDDWYFSHDMQWHMDQAVLSA